MTKQESEEQVLRFEPSAYLQRLIGRELISNEYIAVAELIKNAYDAGAAEVVIELFHDDPQRIVISDNGVGMSLAEFRQLWMKPGYSEKITSSEERKRPLLGEKGIGRFAADKLARKLKVVTKKLQESDALVVEFDWDEFEDRKKLMRDIPIRYSRQSDSQQTRGVSGTRLELEDLRKVWDAKGWKQLRHGLQNLVTPFKTVHRFKIIANAADWDSGEISSPFESQEGYSYEFSLSKAGHLTRKLSRPRQIAKKLRKHSEKPERGIRTTAFGPIKGAFYYVDHPGSLKRRGFESGVGVYRDGFRVESYGRANNDWLEVKLWKAKRHGHAPINPSRLFGYVAISRDDNPDLKDVTNREGLLDTPEFREFRSFVKDEFESFAKIVDEDKKKLEPESEAIKAQRAHVKRETRAQAFADMAAQLAHQLRQPLSHIRTSTTNLSDWLKQKGPLDDIVEQLVKRIDRNIIRMDENIASLSKLAQGLRDNAIEIDLGEFVKEVVLRHQANFEQSGISLSMVNCDDSYVVKFSRVSLGFILDNFLTNALRAASNLEGRNGEVIVRVVQTEEGLYKLSVTDNGDGISPQHRDKLYNEVIPSEQGHGMGLIWSRVWAEGYGGKIGCEDAFPTGATFFLELRREERVTNE